MIDNKNWYQSKTIWGGIIGIAASMLSALGMPVDPATQQALVAPLLQMAGAIGSLTAIYGRLAATDLIN